MTGLKRNWQRTPAKTKIKIAIGFPIGLLLFMACFSLPYIGLAMAIRWAISG